MSRTSPPITVRRAQTADLPAIVRLLFDDELGQKRESFSEPLSPNYYRAFDAIDRDPNQYLASVDYEGKIVGTFHLTFINYLTYGGSLVCQIEAVRVDSSKRNLGVGEAMMNWAINEAKRKGCHRVQLTTNKVRKDAHRFYERLGFKASHEGMKLFLKS